MTSFLVKLFIKDADNVSDPAVRQRYGTLGSGVGVFLNIILFAIKFFAGVLTGSIAVTADAFNNLSDAGSSVVTLIGFKLSEQKPNADHPFGHGRIEYLSGLAVAAAILLMGFELAKSSVQQIFHPSEVTFDLLPAIILAISVAVKLFMSSFNRSLGNRINSAAMKANSSDSLGDAAATSAVLIGSLIGRFTGLTVDGWLGAVVSLVILYAGFNAAKETISPLLGEAPDPEFINQVHDAVMAHEKIKGFHDLIVHDYGPGRLMISLHAEVDCKGDIMELHDEIDNIERELADRFRCHAVIHMDPVDSENDNVANMRSVVSQLAKTIDQGISIHDFRMVSGPTHTNLIFDMVLPHSAPMTPEEATEKMNQLVSQLEGQYYAVITVDRSYV